LVRELDRSEEAKEVISILAKNNPVGLIKKRRETPLRYMKNWKEGLEKNELVENPELPTYVSAIYTDKKDVENVVRDLVKADLGLPITISGIIEDVFDTCKKNGTGPHTVMLSFEPIGRIELLPENEVMEITTMCGHGLISQHLVKHLFKQVHMENMTSEEASFELAKLCVCNSFNHIRANNIINNYISKMK
jgi:hypothetical protein